jgi:hypothetical protein
MITKGSILQSLFEPHCLAIALTDQYTDKTSRSERSWVFDALVLNGSHAGLKLTTLTINWFPITK